MKNLKSDKRGTYRLLRKLGSGGMADVYLGWHEGQRRYYAIKILPKRHRRNRELRERFHRETHTALRLSHSNIVRVSDYKLDAEIPYYVMEYLMGGSLEDRLKAHPDCMPAHEALAYLAPVLKACAYSHRLGIVHRDIKPDNILLDGEGKVYLTDYGLAKDQDDCHLTRAGAMVGTPYYSSPEQARGQRDVDGRSDIYTLGVVLYQMVTGRLPFDGKDAMAVYQRHVFEYPRPARAICPDLPIGVEHMLNKALAKHPEDRYKDAEDMLADVHRLLRGESIDGPLAVPRPLPKQPRKVGIFGRSVRPARSRRRPARPRRSNSLGFFSRSAFETLKLREMVVLGALILTMMTAATQAFRGQDGKKSPGRLQKLATALRLRMASAECTDQTGQRRCVIVPFASEARTRAIAMRTERLMRGFLKRHAMTTVPSGAFEKLFGGARESWRWFFKPKTLRRIQRTFLATHLVLGRVMRPGGGLPVMEVKVFRLRDGRRVGYLRRTMRSCGRVELRERFTALWSKVLRTAS